MDTNDEFDVKGEEQSSPDILQQLHASLQEAIQLEVSADQMEEDLKALKKQLQFIKTGRIPDLMAQLQFENITHMGWKVKVDNFVNGSLPSDEEPRAKAIDWLEKHDGAGLIKTKLSLDFGRSQHNEALSVAAKLVEEGFSPKVESGVHSSTLQAFARERIKNGEPIDTDVLGLYTGKVAKFTAPKEK